jgi:hypothetical protein
VAFGIAAAIGGFCIQPSYALTGAVAFGLAGGLGGLLDFWLTGRQVGLGWGGWWIELRGVLGILLALTLGGGLFGASVD